MQGYIKLHRQIFEWEWYTDGNVKSVFIHCLLKANYTDKKWRGIMIKRGSFITSRNTLSKELKLSEQQIRTAINKLKSTNEITSKTTNEYTLITVCNYDSYQLKEDMNNQQDNQQLNNPITNEQPTSNQRITSTNNNNNKKNKEEVQEKEFTFVLKKDTHIDNVSQEYRDKLKEYILNSKYNTVLSYEKFIEGLESKNSYRYRDFSRVYNKWAGNTKPAPEDKPLIIG